MESVDIMKNYISIDKKLGLITLNAKMSVFFDELHIREYYYNKNAFAIEFYIDDNYKGSIECMLGDDTIVSIDNNCNQIEITTIEELKNLVK